MIAVLFELQPGPGARQAYLDTAAGLRPLLEQIDGFVSIERFQSLADPDRILSLSFWRDEEAVRQWRNLEPHRLAQEAGRERLFADDRLTVVEVLRQSGMQDRREAPADSVERHARPG